MRSLWFGYGFITAMVLNMILHNTPEGVLQNLRDWLNVAGW